MRQGKRPLSPPTTPGTPGPHASDVDRHSRQLRFTGASPASTARLPELRRELFQNSMVLTRTQAQTTDDPTPGTSSTVRMDDEVPLQGLVLGDSQDDLDQDQQDATPRRQQRRPRARSPPAVEDVLTQIANTLTQVQRNLQQPPPEPVPANPEYPADPAFNWMLLRTAPETRFPVPALGAVQRIASDLLARLPTMAARDQHDARFVLAVCSDWPQLDPAMQDTVFQRLNLYAIVANYGWPTAINASTAASAAPPNLLLPPGVLPVQRQQQQRRDQPRQQQQGRRYQQQQQRPPAQAPAPAPAPAPARQGRRRAN